MKFRAETYLGMPVRREVWTILGRSFDLSWPADMDALLDAPETLRRFERDEYMPYWAQPWPSAVLLAESVLQRHGALQLSGGPDPTTRSGEREPAVRHPAQGAGGAAIELGCGIGLVSIAAAMAGWRVTATDYDERAIEFARLNAGRSGVQLAGAQRLDYRTSAGPAAWDLIMGSDLLYERRNAVPLARWIAAALRTGGVALLSDPNRTAADEFPEHAGALGLAVRAAPMETRSPAGPLIRGRIWTVTRRTEVRDEH